MSNPTYYDVSAGRTGHAEVVRVTFDEHIVPKDVLLDIFFIAHDPTTLNRQGADVGTQYRSVMLYSDDAQRREFEQAVARATTVWDDPVVTKIEPLDVFYEAEPEHQDYFNRNPAAGYCSVVILPKVVKARQHYTEWFKNEKEDIV